MIVSEKSHQNLSEYIHFLFRKIFKSDKIGIISRNFENFKRKIESFIKGGGLRENGPNLRFSLFWFNLVLKYC